MRCGSQLVDPPCLLHLVGGSQWVWGDLTWPVIVEVDARWAQNHSQSSLLFLILTEVDLVYFVTLVHIFYAMKAHIFTLN